MTDLSDSTNLVYKAKHKIRFVTAASLFDGHDASINIMRRILQASGAEVIHLGHNRSVEEVVSAALDEDVQGIAVSSYQGGHIEYFRYMVDLLRSRGRIEFIHEVGHLFGLSHCDDPLCVMLPSGKVTDTDRKGTLLCHECRAELARILGRRRIEVGR